MGETQSTMDAADASKDPEMVSKKVDELKAQGEMVSQALFKQVDKLGAECQKALDASNNDSHVAAFVAFRLNSFSELLGNAMTKLQATNQADKGAGSSTTQFKLDEQMVSSVLERIEKLEESHAKLEKTCAQNQAKQAQSNSIKELEQEIHQKLKKKVSHRSMGTTFRLSFSLIKNKKKLQSRMDKVDLLTEKLQTEIDNAQESKMETEQRLETVTTEVKACNSESNKLNEKIKNLQTLVIDSGAQLKKMKSKQKALKQEIVKVKNKDGTASLIFAKRVSSLEKLRKILNGNQSNAVGKTPLRQLCEDADKQVQVVSAKLQTVSGRVQELGTDIVRVTRPAVGFSAGFEEGPRTFNPNAHVKRLFDVTTNIGGCFLPNQGHFIAPHNGLYCFSVKVHQEAKQHFEAILMSKKLCAEVEERYIIIMNYDFPHSASCVLYLSAGEQVFLKIAGTNSSVKLFNTFTFSGWSIGYE